jgi:hypothetical protein
MRSLVPFLFLQALVGCAHEAAPPEAKKPPGALRVPEDCRAPTAYGYRETNDYARATASVVPASLRVETGALQIAPDRLVLTGALVNDTNQAQDLFVNAGIFSLLFAPTDAVKAKPWDGPPRPPPVPLPPMTLKLPPHACLELRGEIYLPDWIYKGAPEVLLRWSLDAWNGARPAGELRARLPAR